MLKSIFLFVVTLVFCTLFYSVPAFADTTLWYDNGTDIYSTTKVGIGYTNFSPSFRLDIRDTGTTNYPVNITSSSGRYLRFGSLNSSYAHFSTNASSGFYFYNPASFGSGNVLMNSSGGNSYIVNGNFGIGITVPSQKLEVNGGIRLNTSTAKPSCIGSIRGTMWFTMGVGTSKDTLEVCAQGTGSTAPAWRTLY